MIGGAAQLPHRDPGVVLMDGSGQTTKLTRAFFYLLYYRHYFLIVAGPSYVNQ